MAPVYKFALIQLQPKNVAPEDNFAKAAAHIRDAAAQGCHLAVLPEYHLTGWCPEHPEFVRSCAASTGYLARYQALAQELDINIVPGTICETHPYTAPDTDTDTDGAANAASPPQLDGTPVEIRNMAYFLCAGTGAIAGAYQKKNLWHPERPHLTAGAHAPHEAFDTPLTRADGSPLRAGMLVCWDLAFPEAFRALIADGAELIIIPSFWTMYDVEPAAMALNKDCERVFLSSVTVARAYENTCAVVFCNVGGLSQVAVPVYGGLGVMEPDEDGMRVVEVDLDVLRLAEESYKVRADMAGARWHYGYTLVKD